MTSSTVRRVGAGALAAAVCLALGVGSAAARPDAPAGPADTPAGPADTAAGPGGQSQVAAEQVEITDHGEVATEVNVRIAATGTLPDGRNVLYLLSDGEPVGLNVVDVATGELIADHLLPPKTIGAAIHAVDDNGAYLTVRDGSGAMLYYWDAGTDQIEEIAENPAGELAIRSLDSDEDGILYGSTYQRAKVFSYDPGSGEIHDYGSVVGDDSYADGLAVHDGVAYVGTGMEVGNAITLDLDSGEVASLDLPAEYREVITRFYSFEPVGDLIAMGFSPSLDDDFEGPNTLFWDTTNEEWTCEQGIPTWLSLNSPYTEQTQDGRLFYKSQGEIWVFDSNDCSVQATGWAETGLAETGSHRTLNLLTDLTGDEAHYLLIGVNNDGSFWSFDPETGDYEYFESEVTGAPLTTHSLHAGLDGHIYAGTYLGPGVIGRFDPSSGEFEQLGGPSQADTFLNFGNQMLVGSYGNAVVHMGDPTGEWDWGTNPEEQFRLIDDHQQDRVVGMDTDGELVALSTVSDYGVPGGALTLTDMDGYRETYRDLVENQSTAAATFGTDGLVYAGTGRRGGLDSPWSPEDAHLVTFDPEAGEVIDTVAPVADNTIVADLVAIDETIWGITSSGHIFGYDTTTAEVTGVHDLGTDEGTPVWGTGTLLEEHPTNGLLYGLSSGSIISFDPQEQRSQIITDDDDFYGRMVIADDGTLYAIDRTNLFSLDVGDSDQSPLDRLTALQTATEEYRGAGEIAGPLAARLENALGQAARQLTDERHLPAVRTLGDFQRHLDPELDPEVITDQAREDLSNQAEDLLTLLD
ncbi:MAG TPA: hypothetical protein VK095_13225 [Beutenbergiaceae bacterium]|nr:hypothetical protein [Beutenbergiaceae bacterium]